MKPQTKLAAKERPIIFSGEMVRAILEGRKTQTRRVIKSQPELQRHWLARPDFFTWRGLDSLERGAIWLCDEMAKRCPHGKQGRQLWVCETFADSGPSDNRHIVYRADFLDNEPDLVPFGGNWTSPSLMPRLFSRLTLEIISVRVERIQEITGGDAWCEGVRATGDVGTYFHSGERLERFHKGWDALNAKRGFGWNVNPFVWVIEFKPVS